jgi:hypothetical protein
MELLELEEAFQSLPEDIAELDDQRALEEDSLDEDTDEEDEIDDDIDENIDEDIDEDLFGDDDFEDPDKKK